MFKWFQNIGKNIGLAETKFGMDHEIKIDSMLFVITGMLFCINYFALNMKKAI
jgi:hypothetical protein